MTRPQNSSRRNLFRKIRQLDLPAKAKALLRELYDKYTTLPTD